jgi:hypothetical protein
VADGMYEVLALIPETSDFSLDEAVVYFAGLTFIRIRNTSKIIKHPLRVELAKGPHGSEPSGFRVHYGDWAIVAWLETDECVQEESEEMAEGKDLPAPHEIIASCTRRLSVWSDEDLEFDWTDQFNEYIDQFRKRFGVFIRDNVQGIWWK